MSAKAVAPAVDRKRLVVVFGQEMPGWGSWDWVGADLRNELGRSFDTATFRGTDIPICNILVIVKHALPRVFVEEAAARAPVVCLSVDSYGAGA